MSSTAPQYEFDEAFQTKVAALCVRDNTFNVRTDGLIEPGYFSEDSEAMLVALGQEHFETYKTVPSKVVLVKLIKDAIASKRIRSDLVGPVRDKVKEILKTDISDRDYVVDETAKFARHQAIYKAMESSIGFLEDREFEKIDAAMAKAMMVGANDASPGSDYVDAITARTQRRKDKAAGITVPTITTGFRALDDALGGGWGRKELAVLLGPAKRGKSFGLMNFAVNGALAGYNVLKVTLENSLDRTEDRMDAFVSGYKTADLESNMHAVEAEVRRKFANAGRLRTHEYPTGSFSPSDLKRLIERYRAQGVTFDLIVIDYWDIMKPDIRYKDDKIEESRSVGVALRAIAQEEDCAVVTAVQSNREGFKAHVATADTVAEDFNKVRLADVFFSINADDDERANQEARLFMAAMRNQEGGYTINIKQDLSRAAFITGVLGRAGV